MKKTKKRFAAAAGFPISDEEALRFGPALVAVAEKMRVNDIRNLDKRALYKVVEADKKHPLRDFVFNCGDAEAALAYRIDRCGLLIRGIRYIETDRDGLNRLVQDANKKKLFISARSPVVEEGSGKTRQCAVLREDLLRHDPSYISAVAGAIRRARDAAAQLVDLTTSREPPFAAGELAQKLQDAHLEYEAKLQNVERAAE